jgi:hypothetical protein
MRLRQDRFQRFQIGVNVGNNQQLHGVGSVLLL